MNTPHTEPRELLTPRQFIILSIATFGLYDLWWIFKSWRFFRDREQSSIHSAMRTMFSVFYLIPLLKRIRAFAAETGYSTRFSPWGIYLATFLLNFPSVLPEPLSYLSVFSCLPLLPALNALNFAILQTEGDQAVVQTSYNRRQRLLLIAGGFVWLVGILAVIGQLMMAAAPTEALPPYQG